MEVLDILQRVITKLEELRIPYMVSGSAASSLHAFVRTTQDGDLVVDLPLDQIEKFAAAFATEFYLDRASIYRSVQIGGSFNLIHFESSLKIDFFPLRKRRFSLQEFARRQPRLLLNKSSAPAYVATAEDSILSKLEWVPRRRGSFRESMERCSGHSQSAGRQLGPELFEAVGG